jgi:mono/diheme cytochrome c family protein
MKFPWLFRRLLPALLSLPFVLPGLGAQAEEGLDAAAGDFRTYCATCHGVEGRGEGPVAEHLKTRPADLTGIARRNGGTYSREAVYTRIEGLDMPGAHGSSDMPVWGMWFTSQAVGESFLVEDAAPAAERARNRIEALVAYIETLQE